MIKHYIRTDEAILDKLSKIDQERENEAMISDEGESEVA